MLIFRRDVGDLQMVTIVELWLQLFEFDDRFFALDTLEHEEGHYEWHIKWENLVIFPIIPYIQDLYFETMKSKINVSGYKRCNYKRLIYSLGHHKSISHLIFLKACPLYK